MNPMTFPPCQKKSCLHGRFLGNDAGAEEWIEFKCNVVWRNLYSICFGFLHHAFFFFFWLMQLILQSNLSSEKHGHDDDAAATPQQGDSFFRCIGIKERWMIYICGLKQGYAIWLKRMPCIWKSGFSVCCYCCNWIWLHTHQTAFQFRF